MRNKKNIVSFLLIFIFFIGFIPFVNADIDYSNPANWAYNGVGENKKVDLFLIAPTVYFGSENNYNMLITDTETKQSFLGALNMERGIYENSCRMYAPYYRQVGLNVYRLGAREAKPYLNIAYEDVKEAFEYYMENKNNNKPVVIAGFSQGSDMALRLLKDYFYKPKHKKLLVAAYLIGWPVTEKDVRCYPYLKMAQGEKDTGVIITFNSEATNVNTSIIVPRKTLGINPLNWSTNNSFADKSLNKGAVFTNYEGNINREIPGLCGAYLDSCRGTLKVTDVSSEDYPPILDLFEDGVYHLYDYQFFFRNLQENVEVRVSEYLNIKDI
ncbi:DUF3089 domain-containing protein [Selenomonadales bacterium OttesenSCG-928-I06]|nr:DUF3089 domain-containing protein [Selenomonadales bacterium OttesenSCG-928-I06]